MNATSNKAGDAKRQELLKRIRADIAATSDEEDAAVTAAALTDPDNLPNQPIKRMGRPPAAVTKEPVTIRLDRDVVAFFKATGDGWQTRVNDALRKAARLK